MSPNPYDNLRCHTFPIAGTVPIQHSTCGLSLLDILPSLARHLGQVGLTSSEHARMLQTCRSLRDRTLRPSLSRACTGVLSA